MIQAIVLALEVSRASSLQDHQTLRFCFTQCNSNSSYVSHQRPLTVGGCFQFILHPWHATSLAHVTYITILETNKSLAHRYCRCSLRISKNGIYVLKAAKLVSPFNPLNPELNRICYLLALLGTHDFLHVRRIRVKLLTLRRLMSYIYIWSTYSWCF